MHAHITHYTHTHTHTRTHTHARAHTCTWYTYICTHMHTHTHTHARCCYCCYRGQRMVWIQNNNNKNTSSSIRQQGIAACIHDAVTRTLATRAASVPLPTSAQTRMCSHPLVSALLPDLRSIPDKCHCRWEDSIARHSCIDWVQGKEGSERRGDFQIDKSCERASSASQGKQLEFFSPFVLFL